MPDTTAPTTLYIRGEFTIFTANALKEWLLDTITQATTQDIEINLSDVVDIDSAGLQLMVMAQREAHRLGQRIHFQCHSHPVRSLIYLCGLASVFGMSDLPTGQQQ